MKIYRALICTLLLLALTACRSGTADAPPSVPTETAAPAPTQSQAVPTLPVETEPLEESPAPVETDPLESSPAEITPTETELPDHLINFDFYSISMIVPSSGVSCEIYGEEQTAFQELLNMETWTAPPDVPPMDLSADWVLYDYSGNSLLITPWDDETCLILTKTGADLGTGYLYAAPISVYTNCNGFIRQKFANNLSSYSDIRFESCEINGTHAVDDNYYLDHYIYLFDEEQSDALSALFDFAGRVDIAGEWLGGGYDDLYRFTDSNGGEFCITAMRQNCLINYFPAEGGAFRSFAPLSFLDELAAFMDGVTPLGVVNNTAEHYYDLFRQEWGLEWLIGWATEDGSFCPDQLLPFAARRALAYEINEPPVILTEEEVLERHFGLPYPNVELSGRDCHYGAHLVPEDERVDEAGVVTALFRCYFIPDSFYELDSPDYQKLSTMKQHLLTGCDDDFPEPFFVEISFEERFDIETQTSYVFYHSLKVLE